MAVAACWAMPLVAAGLSPPAYTVTGAFSCNGYNISHIDSGKQGSWIPLSGNKQLGKAQASSLQVNKLHL